MGHVHPHLLALFLIFGPAVASTAPAQTAPAQTAPARDAAATAAAAGIIRGRVVAAADGRPLHRVRVTVNAPGTEPPSAVTDTRGVFEIANVPPGVHSLTAARAGYLTIQYGQRRPREAGRTIEISGGQVVDGVDIPLFRGGVLAGRVSDEIGDPSAGVRVEAIELRYINGRRVPVAARIATTNDAGEFRLADLEPGAYQIRASTTEAWESDDGKETFVYAVTYYPAVKEGDNPQSINVSIGQEVGGLDFRLLAGRAARLTGIVEDVNGLPVAAHVVRLSRLTRRTGGSLLSSGSAGMTKTDAKGAFEFSKLAPGEYMAYTGTESERSSESLFLHDGSVRHVVLTPRKSTAVTGRIVTDDGALPPFAPARVQIAAIAMDADQPLPRWGAPAPLAPKPDWTFRLSDMDGQYLFRVLHLPDGWMLKAVVAGGRDVADIPLPVVRGTPDVDGLQLVVSRKAGKVSGTVVDTAGAPSADATIIVFGGNRSAWGPASRFIRAVRPDGEGRFVIGGLPPGSYRIVARDFVIDGQWEDPEFLDGIVREAGRLELTEGATTEIKLTLGAPR